ncbi:DUF2680 domain-containing protein [Pullulanibacillus sp. KACC 23026]|uniref:DUF2680 domain-containing protein n=1 Tax=Pullulanibacillus sp. KACC 23026 TaxID=3028315 RepID=UPI0023B01EF4|nr:DUF2680 domain-containing protein [Pullulanibacillus sp. KACC 23026]WEG11856.1 DUF2680 domain-containing protein [Pullulanibacillus sp. KACC 23026]
MKRFMPLLASFLIGMGIFLPQSSAGAVTKAAVKTQQPQLTAEQKMEIKTIRQRILKGQIDLINKYVEFGVLTRDKGDALISDLKSRETKWQNDVISQSQEKNKKPAEPKQKTRTKKEGSKK